MKFLNLLKKPINTYKMYKTVRAENPTMSRRQALEAVDYKLDPTRVSVYEDAMYGVDKVGFKGYTEEEVKQIQSTPEGREKLNKAYEEQQKMLSKMKKAVPVAAVVATQSQSQQTQQTQTEPTRWTKTVVRKYNALQESLITTGRTWGATTQQLQKIMHMDPDKLWEIGVINRSYFDELFEYVYSDIEYNFHGHPGLQKIIDKYEERFGEIVL